VTVAGTLIFFLIRYLPHHHMRAVVRGIKPEHQMIITLRKTFGEVIPVTAGENERMLLHGLLNHRICQINNRR
jgi:hypothetical protein